MLRARRQSAPSIFNPRCRVLIVFVLALPSTISLGCPPPSPTQARAAVPTGGRLVVVAPPPMPALVGGAATPAGPAALLGIEVRPVARSRRPTFEVEEVASPPSRLSTTPLLAYGRAGRGGV